MRVKLAESPAFAKLKEDGEVCQGAAPRSVRPAGTICKRVLIAFFAIMCAQGAVWYFTFFYVQVFLDQVARRARTDQGDLLLVIMTLVSAPLYVFFGWLSRPHRPQAGDASAA